MYLTISTSTNAQSRSARLAKAANHQLSALTANCRLIDLADFDLPLDNGSSCGRKDVREVSRRIGEAQGIVLIVPIYHGDVSVSTRNLVQLCGTSWHRKVIGLVSVAGEAVSHSAVVDFASLLMLEYRSFIVPDFVFVDSKTLLGGSLDDKTSQKIDKMVGYLVRVTEALKLA